MASSYCLSASSNCFFLYSSLPFSLAAIAYWRSSSGRNSIEWINSDLFQSRESVHAQPIYYCSNHIYLRICHLVDSIDSISWSTGVTQILNFNQLWMGKYQRMKDADSIDQMWMTCLKCCSTTQLNTLTDCRSVEQLRATQKHEFSGSFATSAHAQCYIYACIDNNSTP